MAFFVGELNQISALYQARSTVVFSPPVTPENYPILFNFTEQPLSQDIHHEAVEKVQANHHEATQPPPEPPDDQDVDQLSVQGGRPRRFPRVDYEALDKYGCQGTGQEGRWRERRDRERRGAPDK